MSGKINVRKSSFFFCTFALSLSRPFGVGRPSSRLLLKLDLPHPQTHSHQPSSYHSLNHIRPPLFISFLLRTFPLLISAHLPLPSSKHKRAILIGSIAFCLLPRSYTTNSYKLVSYLVTLFHLPVYCSAFSDSYITY